MELLIGLFVVFGIFLIIGMIYIRSNKANFEKAKVKKNYRKKKKHSHKKKHN